LFNYYKSFIQNFKFMKTSTLRRMTVMLFALLITGYFTASAVLTISSMKGTGLPMYPQHNSAAATTLIPGLTLDYKVVTISGKSWAWTNIHGANIGGASYSSQLRYYSSTYAKTENNLLNRVTGSTTQTYGSTTNTIPAAPLKISFFQDANGFNESDFIPYDITAINSPVSGDITVPVISSCTSSGVTETAATINITGTDDSGDLFYYITGNGIAEISFLPSISLAGLTPTTNYNLTVTPIDFTGNMGTPSNVSFTTGGLVQITSGIAQGIKFVLKSTTTQLEYYYQLTDPTKKFRDAFLQITPAGGTMFEIKPTLSPDSTYVYGVSTDATIANSILSLNCGYWIAPGLPDYSDYVVTNTTITSGTLTGTPIKHQMGGGISAAEAETTPPVLNSVTLKDATPNYVKLNINGSDNSGTVYYKITGAKSSSDDAFRTGDYYLTDIDPGKVYNLTVTPYDLSGNTAAAQTLTVKTMNARSNIKDSTTTNYNTLILPIAPNGELVTIIKQTGNVLTLGCTTKSLLIPAGASRDKKFNNPTVVINGTTYPLTISADSLTATTTFSGTIGSTVIANGTSLGVQWSVYWGSAGPGGAISGGHYFTPAGAGAFTYVIGDSGQNDVTGPSAPVLTLNGNLLTWPACTDDISGVKMYTVSETGQTPVTIFDLGGTSFSYNMISSSSPTTVTAMDFVGNTTIAKINQGVTANKPVTLNSTVVYPNPATDRIYISGDVAELALYSLQGQLVRSVINKNTLDVSAFAKGLYLIKVTDKQGNQKSSKLEIQ
jgi:hypothetical protein